MTIEAKWNGAVIASSNETVVVEGNHYFPRAAVNDEYLSDSETTTFCPWKGTANYHSLTVNGETNEDAAWYYADPKEKAAKIKGHVAFRYGVEVG